MRFRAAARLRNHLHVLIIVPLVVIVMTWPVLPRLFNGDEFWLHSELTIDVWQKIWDAWHLGRVLDGQAQLFYTDAMFHPVGISLVFHAASTPHAFLLHALQPLLPIDDAYNLLYLLTLCFNAFCAYALIFRLLADKWIALYGAVVVGSHPWFTDLVTSPDLLTMGTLPLSLYWLHRSVTEKSWRSAALAGICAGVTAFIGIYTFMFLLISVAMYALYLALSRWRQPGFWLGLLLLLAICAGIAWFRVYPMMADAALLEEGLEHHNRWRRGRDLLEFFVLPANPTTGGFFGAIVDSGFDDLRNFAYPGYINIFLLACAIRRRSLRRKFAPWLLLFSVFAVLRLGDHLVVNGVTYEDIALPEHHLGNLFPSTLGQVGHSFYYHIGMMTPLAVLSCFGLYALLQAKPARLRAAFALLSIAILAIETFIPRQGFTLEGGEAAYIDWLRAEEESAIRLIDLPQYRFQAAWFLYAQTLSDYPTAYGWANRNRDSARGYIDSNHFLRSWQADESVHCLPYNERAYLSALEQLRADGFTHVVVHKWLYGDQFIIHSFRGLAPAYADGFVSVYRLRDLRQSCESLLNAPPRFSRLATSPLAIPGDRSSILSFHPSERVDDETFAYLDSLFDDWQSLMHLYQDDGVWTMQSSGTAYADADAFASDNQVIYLLYNTNETDRAQLNGITSLDDFALCQTESYEDGATIEVYLREGFSCALIDPSGRLRVEYDNGFAFENILAEADQDILEVQLLWRRRPSEPHSFSLQVFDAAGAKALGQDSTIGHKSLARQRVDISSLPAGAYAVKLIVYNFHTGQRAPGIVIGNDARFESALEIATIIRS